MRSIPLPDKAITLLVAWQNLSPEGCPYVFMEQERWEHYRVEVEAGRWRPDRDLVNNVLRRYKTLCRQSGVGPYTIHDLRRSCITNWAQKLPMHVVQEFAGHSDIKTTEQFYLSVQPGDVAKAESLQARVLGFIPKPDLTDPELTHSGENGLFRVGKAARPKRKCLTNGHFGNHARQDSNL